MAKKEKADVEKKVERNKAWVCENCGSKWGKEYISCTNCGKKRA